MNFKSAISLLGLLLICANLSGQEELPNHYSFEWMTSPQVGYSPISYTYEGQLDSILNVYFKIPPELHMIKDPIITKTHTEFIKIFADLSFIYATPCDSSYVLRLGYVYTQPSFDSLNLVKYNKAFPESATPPGNNHAHVKGIVKYLKNSGAETNYNNSVRYADSETVKLFNADSLITFNLSLPAGEPFPDKYPYCTAIFLTKKNYAHIPIFFFSNEYVEGPEKYIEILKGNLWYWNERGLNEAYDKRRDSLNDVRFKNVWGVPLNKPPVFLGKQESFLIGTKGLVSFSIPDDFAYIYKSLCWSLWDKLRLTPIFGGDCFFYTISTDREVMVLSGGVRRVLTNKRYKKMDPMQAWAYAKLDASIGVIRDKDYTRKMRNYRSSMRDYPRALNKKKYLNFLSAQQSHEMFEADRVLFYDLPLPVGGYEGYNYCKGLIINKGELNYMMYFLGSRQL